MERAEGYFMDGTSCATPVRPPFSRHSTSENTQLSTSLQTVAGVISLLNDYLLSTNRPALGFLNPLLYGEALPGINDITSGSNPGCGTGGFSAIAGWDPVRPTWPVSSHSMLADFRLCR
jgi:hypothetical protein